MIKNNLDICEILKIENTIYESDANSKKSVLELASKLISKDLINIEDKEIFDCFLEREKISSTSINNGIAIPHCCDENIFYPVSAFICLADPVDFTSVDSVPVTFVFAILMPKQLKEENCQALEEVVNLFKQKGLYKRLKEAKNREELYNLLVSLSNT